MSRIRLRRPVLRSLREGGGFGGQAGSNAAWDWDEYVAENTSYSHNGLNQTTSAGSTNFTYDGRGNPRVSPGLRRGRPRASLTSDGTETYAYDVENHLINVSGGRTLAYDPLSRLYEASDGVTATKFLTDGADVIAEYDPGSESGAGAAGTTLLRRHVHG